MARNHPLLVWDSETSGIYVGITSYLYSSLAKPDRSAQVRGSEAYIRFCTIGM